MPRKTRDDRGGRAAAGGDRVREAGTVHARQQVAGVERVAGADTVEYGRRGCRALAPLAAVDADRPTRAGLDDQGGARPEQRFHPLDGARKLRAVGETADLEVVEEHVVAVRDPRGDFGPQRRVPALRRPIGIEGDAVAETG